MCEHALRRHCAGSTIGVCAGRRRLGRNRIGGGRQGDNGANGANRGIILDLWQVVKPGLPYQELRRIALRLLTGVAFNDGQAMNLPCRLRAETIHHRPLCGQGEFDLRGFIDTIAGMGYTGAWGVEVLCESMREWPLDELARCSHASTAAQYAQK